MSSKNSGLSGQLYEIHLLTMFLLRGSKLKCKYFLGTNVEKAGDFDDVVFKYQYRDESGAEKWKVVLLQAKHRDNPEKSKITFKQLTSEAEKGDFNLKKYLKSYRKIMKNFSTGKPDLIFGCHYDELVTVIFTNALSDFKNNKNSIDKLDAERDGILNLFEKIDYSYYQIITSGENYSRTTSVLEYCTDCKKLAREFTKSIFSETGVALNEGILRDYHVPLESDVIQMLETEGIGFFKESFLNSDSEFRRAILDEVRKKPEFTGKSEDELMSELRRKSFKISHDFSGGTNTINGNYPKSLPEDLVSESEMKEFLDGLKLFVEQPGEEELAEIIKEEIQETYKVEQEDIASVFSVIRWTVLDWWRKGTHYLTDNNRVFKDAIRISFRFDVKQPVDLFTGRTTELKTLHEILQNGREVVISQTASVTGLGGIGKSELARKYISEYYQLYDDNIIWINADNYSTISESFRRLAKERLRIETTDKEGKEKSTKDIVSDVYFFFARWHRKSLFVFDNAGKYRTYMTEDGVSSYLPFGPDKPHVLITSRDQEWGDIKSLPLTLFTREEAAEFIKEALKYVLDMKDDEVNRLAEAVQYLPLALRQAVAYIKMQNHDSNKKKSTTFTIGKYLTMFENNAEELLGQAPSASRDRYTETVLTTWTITTERIKKDMYGKLALDIFVIIAYLACDNIPVELIFSNYNISEKELHKSVELLDQYSLVTLEVGRLSIHRMVQKVTNIRLEKQDKGISFINKAHDLLQKCFPRSNNRADVQTQMVLLPHLEAVLHHTQNWKHNQPDDLEQSLCNYNIFRCIIECSIL